MKMNPCCLDTCGAQKIQLRNHSRYQNHSHSVRNKSIQSIEPNRICQVYKTHTSIHRETHAGYRKRFVETQPHETIRYQMNYLGHVWKSSSSSIRTARKQCPLQLLQVPHMQTNQRNPTLEKQTRRVWVEQCCLLVDMPRDELLACENMPEVRITQNPRVSLAPNLLNATKTNGAHDLQQIK